MASDSEESDLIEAKEPIGPVNGSMDDERLKSAGFAWPWYCIARGALHGRPCSC